MSQDRTIARPYAKAVFELAQNEKAFSQWSEMLELAATIATDKQAVSLMHDPKYDAEWLIKLFLEIGGDHFTPSMRSFVQILGRFKRLALLPEIKALYEEMREEAERLVTVQFISAYPVNEQEQIKFKEALRRKMGCEILLECVTDQNLLGGAIIRAKDIVIDGSIRGRLAKLSEAVGIS